jgi:hypothetical protein
MACPTSQFFDAVKDVVENFPGRFSFAASGLKLVAAGHPCQMADMKPRHAALALSDWYLT